ncbi:hypothetical protein PJ985_17565 [Streptomyces sp. ACA25]|uniref:hypothetical protein n=1 Tax=Streptomyces sp. ACA25 TaxID=3022596 RepID=UPI002307C695|nr:hypothetical protein [Streptomyces sp. ACA25]MDB1089375.1 hypothetical protein [Streptomyces sp. ACA25]
MAVVADEAGFARMRGYRSFRFTDHPEYLRHVEAHLRALTAHGGHTGVVLLDPGDYADYCAEFRLDPDSAESRARYTAETAHRGAAVRYRGQRIGRLIPGLLAEHDRQLAWESASAELAGAGLCAGCGRSRAVCLFDHATRVLTAAVGSAGPGLHHAVCTVLHGEEPLTAALHAEVPEEGAPLVPDRHALVFCTVLAAGLASSAAGGLVLRSGPVPGTGPGRETVRGWSLTRGRLRALSEAEVFAAYCTDPQTGEPVPPEAGVVHRPGTGLPPYPCG